MYDISINDNDPVKITPIHKPRRKLKFRYKLLVSLFVLAAVSGYIHHKDINTIHKVPELSYLSEYPVVDPEVKIVAAYQKARYSNIAIEIAELQAEILVRAARKYNIPVPLVVGVADQESMFDARNTSSAGAAGLLQILSLEGIVIDQKRKYDLEYNVDTGCRGLLIKYKKAGGNWSKALAFYSGFAKDYDKNVYERMGRYAMFKEGYQTRLEEVAQLRKELNNSIN